MDSSNSTDDDGQEEESNREGAELPGAYIVQGAGIAQVNVLAGEEPK